ncbi:MAG: hypothetical protein IT285_16165 [Bdellovibrionales bacterium]|nr:hypothetical protein [Bdellovibrionales bacterium]
MSDSYRRLLRSIPAGSPTVEALERMRARAEANSLTYEEAAALHDATVPDGLVWTDDVLAKALHWMCSNGHDRNSALDFAMAHGRRVGSVQWIYGMFRKLDGDTSNDVNVNPRVAKVWKENP